jgi:23S rRNA G2069 N7-methylase RlmK/C1962 C5-methylase RlmI
LPTCPHVDAQPQPATVLDPFAGSGTTGLVARRLGRRFVGIDLSADYLQLARQRLGLTDLDAWNSGDGRQVEDDFAELPLFGGQP